MLKRIDLYSTLDTRLCTAWIPAFKDAPQVVTWNNRYFNKVEDGKYVEIFAFNIPYGFDSINHRFVPPELKK